MNSNRVFWGAIFLIVGALILLGNFNLLSFDWGYIWRLWPLILIFLGVSSMVGSARARWITLVVIIILAGFLIATGPFVKDKQFSGWGSYWNNAATTKTLVIPADMSVKTASLKFESGAGDFDFGGTTDQLISASATTNMGDYTLDATKGAGSQSLTLSLNSANHFWFGHHTNKVSVSLDKEVLWDLDLHYGAASLNMDLSAYKIGNLQINCGAASQTIRLGDLADTLRVTIKTGASSTNISLPSTVGAEIQMDAALNSNTFSGFDKVSGGTYRTSNFNDVTKKIYLSIFAGASSINISRY